jgi:hypothetical protein
MYGSCGGDEVEVELEKKTRANPGAGTGMVQVLLGTLQLMVVTLRLPVNRPSTEKSPPRV